MTEEQQHDVSRNVIDLRWHLRTFEQIATELGITEEEITQLRETEPYEMQVWACYGRTPYIFNRHRDRNRCIQHIAHFFGINAEQAEEVLGNDWKAPEPVQLSLF